MEEQVQATYSLAPSHTDLTTISVASSSSGRASPISHELLAAVEEDAHGKTQMVVTEDGPVIVMT